MGRWTGLLMVGVMGCTGTHEADEVASSTSALVYGADDRAAMTDAFFAAFPAWRAMGRISTSIGTCTATHVGQNYLITSRHCVADLEVPGNVVFRPGFAGLDARSGERPSIRARRVMRGTGSFGKFSNGGAYFPGGDWAFIEVDPGTYQQGTVESGFRRSRRRGRAGPRFRLARFPTHCQRPSPRRPATPLTFTTGARRRRTSRRTPQRSSPPASTWAACSTRTRWPRPPGAEKARASC
jgi:hypothetical protein